MNFDDQNIFDADLFDLEDYIDEAPAEQYLEYEIYEDVMGDEDDEE